MNPTHASYYCGSRLNQTQTLVLRIDCSRLSYALQMAQRVEVGKCEVGRLRRPLKWAVSYYPSISVVNNIIRSWLTVVINPRTECQTLHTGSMSCGCEMFPYLASKSGCNHIFTGMCWLGFRCKTRFLPLLHTVKNNCVYNCVFVCNEATSRPTLVNDIHYMHKTNILQIYNYSKCSLLYLKSIHSSKRLMLEISL
jgi:hypothetical protein